MKLVCLSCNGEPAMWQASMILGMYPAGGDARGKTCVQFDAEPRLMIVDQSSDEAIRLWREAICAPVDIQHREAEEPSPA